MADKTTFFAVDRCIFENWIWNEKPFDCLHAWIYIIGKANYADKKHLYRGKLQETKRGQLQTSYGKLAEDWGWSRNKVINFLAILEHEGMISKESTTLGTTLTVENYAKFQDLGYTKGIAESTAEGTAESTAQGLHNNQGNQDNQENNISLRRPDRETVRSFISSLGLSVDPDKFFDYYEDSGWSDSRGKPIRDWKKLARTWDNNKPIIYEAKPKQSPMDALLAEIKTKGGPQ